MYSRGLYQTAGECVGVRYSQQGIHGRTADRPQQARNEDVYESCCGLVVSGTRKQEQQGTQQHVLTDFCLGT